MACCEISLNWSFAGKEILIMIWAENQTETVGKCDMCGSSDLVFLAKRPDGLPVSECTKCGFSFLGRRPYKDAIAAYYDKAYFQDSSTYQDYFSYARAVTELGYCPRLHRLEPFINDWKSKKVLEIGCAAGSTLALIERLGGEVEGIEISEIASRIANEHFKIKVFNGSYEEAVINNNSFDFILMFDVLEHILAPGKAIDHIGEVLKQNGFFALTVPNFDRFTVEGLDWAGIQSWFEHINYFKSDVLCNRIEDSGFRIVGQHTYTAGLNKSGKPENHTMRSLKIRLKQTFHFLEAPFRIARKLKFILKGPPYLDVRRDKSGMDLFILAQKKY